jgi:multiple sugar transport system ATP-binding protein
MTMGQRIAVMSQAKLQQVGTPRELYDHPANKFVAGFIGSPAMNFLSAELIGSGESAALTVAGITFVLPAHYREVVGATSGAKFTLGVRPEHLNVAPGDVPTVAVQTVADVVEYLGNEVLLHAMVDDVDVVALVGREHHVRPGDVISLHIPLDQFHLFHADSDLAVSRPRFAPARPVVS